MSAYWAQMSTRERVLALCMLTILFVGGLWFFVLFPLVEERQLLQKRIEQGEKDLAYMQTSAATIKHTGSSEPVKQIDNSVPAYLVTDRLLKKMGLKAARLDPVGDTRVRLQFTRIRFDQLVSLLDQLSSQAGLDSASATFERQGNGEVSARLELERRS